MADGARGLYRQGAIGFVHCIMMLMVPCSLLCGTRTKRLSAIAQQPFSTWLMEHPSYGNWAGGIVKQYSRLGMVSPFSSFGITCLNSLGFQANMKGLLCRVWGGLHVSPRTAPSKRAKLCTYFAGFLRPSQLKTVPYLSFQCPFPGYGC